MNMITLATPDERAAFLQQEYGYTHISHRKWRALPGTPGETHDTIGISPSLASRVISAYQRPIEAGPKKGSHWLTLFNEHHQPSHDALMRGDVETVISIWQNPADNYSFWGFDEINAVRKSQQCNNPLGQELAALYVYDNLLQLAAAVGVSRLEYFEAPDQPREGIEELLTKLDERFGFRINFPNPWPFEYGLSTSRGVAGYRSIQALFQNYQVRRLTGQLPDARILEIGAGQGRSAYYAYQSGIRDYTIIDLPFTSVSQSFFLGTTLGQEAVTLNGETGDTPIKILPPDHFLSGEAKYDIIVNFDSITEMDIETQRSYMAKILRSTDLFLSVNHEYNELIMSDLIREFLPQGATTRDPYWMRRGYVQEILRNI